MVFVSVSIMIIEIEEMPCLRVPKQMSGKQPSFVKCGVHLIGSLLSGWFKLTDAVPCECRKVCVGQMQMFWNELAVMG